MAHVHQPDEIPAAYLPRSGVAKVVGGLLVLVGAVAFAVALATDPEWAWRGYVVNWLFFTAIAAGAVVFTVATRIVKARWNWSVKRVSLSFVAFLPVSFLLFLPMLGLGADYFPWIEEMAHDPILQNKAAYLNMPFLVTRNVVGLLVLFGMSVYFAYLAVRPDLGLTDRDAAGSGAPGDDAGRRRWRELLARDWRGQEAEEVRSYRRMARLGPAIVLVYAMVMSVVSYDWIMSLEPHWFSTLFGAWFFMGAFWGGIAATALLVTWLKRKVETADVNMGILQLHDLGKLTFAFCVFWAYLFWSQYIVIWYGKLPWEQSWIVTRSGEAWGGLSAAVVVLCFVLPFAGLLGRKPKVTPPILATFTGIILVGLWLEKYVMVVPSLHHGEGVFSWWVPAIGLGFLGLFVLSVRWFLSTFPVIQLWRPMVEAELVEAEVREDMAETRRR